MKERVCWFSVFVKFLLLFFLNCEGYEKPFDIQYLPDGVNKSDYQLFYPGAKSVVSPTLLPPHWWTDLKKRDIQLLIHDTDISTFIPSIDHSAFDILEYHSLESPNYLFIDIRIKSDVPTGSYPILLTNSSITKTYEFKLFNESATENDIDPLDVSDRIYLIFPDRFSNGEISNDRNEDFREVGIDRSKMYFRHGGDLQGIIDHLSYIKELGFTAIWLNPVIESDQPYSSYHGYAKTAHYKIDERFGGIAKYKELADSCHVKGIKLIKDVVPNHVGDYHWFVQDIPSKDWIHQDTAYLPNNHLHSSTFDETASAEEKAGFLDGWFDYSMPDLNQQHPDLAKFLIQNSIWWIREVGIDGFRIDTYGYSDPDFMAKWAKEIKYEFANFNLFGETWMESAEYQALLTAGSNRADQIDTKLDGITDFVLSKRLVSALLAKDNSKEAVHELVSVMKVDSLYKNGRQNVVSLDNHDMDRFYSVVDENIELFKTGLTLLYGLRGIPCIYYGTEILHKNFKQPDGLVRSDFEGGWPDDLINKFNAVDRSPQENQAWFHIKKLNLLRDQYPVIVNGVFHAEIYEDYVFSLIHQDSLSKIQLLFNANAEQEQIIDFTSQGDNGLDLISGEKLSSNKIILKAKEGRLILWK